MKLRTLVAFGAGVAMAAACTISTAQANEETAVITVGGKSFATWQEYVTSEQFKELGLRCQTPDPIDLPENLRGGSGSDCGNITNPDPMYDPVGGTLWEIPVVVHILMNTAGTAGNISDALVQSQIDILNEDFLALAGTNGAPGTDVQIQFKLATEDPAGDPTTGITRTQNTTWYNDSGTYYNTLAWDPDEYLNIYTNQAGGALGYVPFLPHQGAVGSNSDRVVCLWSAFGRNAPIGPPYNQGRTVTHEVGHYLGLYHTFNSGCGTTLCYNSGDRICDTNPEAGARFGCPAVANSCSPPSADPIHNYMDYTDDLCMWEFTPEQGRRMRCTMEHWRPTIGNPVVTASVADYNAVAGLSLDHVVPNPVRHSTAIDYSLETSGPVRIAIYDVNGREVRALVNAVQSAGSHSIVWDGRDRNGAEAAMGEYFIRLQRGSESVSGKVLVLR